MLSISFLFPHIKQLIAIAGCLLVLGSAAHAGTEEDVLAYRDLFQLLDKEGPNGRVLDRSAWPDHDMLASYLDLDILRHPDFKPAISDLRRFMERWPNHPQIERVLKLMDNAMTQTGDNEETLAWYEKRPPKSSAGIVRLMNLMVGKKQYDKAAVLWRQFYRDGGSIPESLLDFAKEVNIRLTQDDYEARAYALLAQGKKKLYQVQLLRLPKNRQNYFQALEAAKAGHPSFNKLVTKLSGKDVQSSEMWFEWINNLRANNKHNQAQKLLTGREGRWLTPAHRYSLNYRQARAMLYHEDSPKEAFEVLEPNVREMGGKLDDSLWLSAWSAYLMGRQGVALERMQQLAKEGVGAERRSHGGYWAAKILEEQGQSPKAMLESAAQSPEHFYGLLAAEALGKSPTSQQNREDCITLRNNPAIADDVQRLVLLRAVNRTGHNISEIQSMADRHALTPKDQLCLAVVYTEAEHTLKLAKKFQNEKGVADWEGLFPAPKNWKPLTGWQLDPALIWSLARQESAFTPDAVSWAGAQGLIQLMPATARGEAKLLSYPKPTAKLLNNPEYNLALGQNHLLGLVKRLGGDLALSLAAYNAGTGRAVTWRAFRNKESLPLFFEKIPFTETREYVKRVLHGYAAYQWVLYGKGSLTAMIQPGSPGLSNVLANRPVPVVASPAAQEANPLLGALVGGGQE